MGEFTAAIAAIAGVALTLTVLLAGLVVWLLFRFMAMAARIDELEGTESRLSLAELRAETACRAAESAKGDVVSAWENAGRLEGCQVALRSDLDELDENFARHLAEEHGLAPVGVEELNGKAGKR
jgi:hypothetical protein